MMFMKIFIKIKTFFVNEKVIGKVKDEVKGKIICDFVKLKSKMYSLIVESSEEIKKAKGFNKNVVKNIGIKNMLMFWLMKKWWDIKWKEFEANYIELELMMFVKFLCVVLMIKDTY